jgi:Zn-dependent protease with chaperone function
MKEAPLYPPSPQLKDDQRTAPSAEFKREVRKVLLVIVAFIVVYLALIAGAIALAILSGLGAFWLVALYTSFITIMLGIGLAGFGLMVLYFLVKFVFRRNVFDRSGLIEVKASDQPELFAFIHKLTQEVGSPFPKKIYLSPDVNACVFYDSGFWSMFLPVRKNLQIGLGLVNSMNMSEFKAVLAHEFGHFSQRSMKLGSYVYNVNHIIHNLLYDNDTYGEALEKWGNASGYFALFASLTAGVVKGIQKVLQAMYSLINKSYMSLSRQMEFHADAVAASVSGSHHLVTSLRRLDVAGDCYQTVINYYGQWLGEGLKGKNLYAHHSIVLNQFALEYHLPVEHGLPVVDKSFYDRFRSSRLVIKDQWASHPSTDDREAQLNALGYEAGTLGLPAWSVFSNPVSLQEQMTEKLYANTSFEKEPQPVDAEGFRVRHMTTLEKYKIPPVYKNYYAGRPFPAFDPAQPHLSVPASLEEIVTDEAVGLLKKLQGIQSDLEALRYIESRQLMVSSFEFAGKKYKRRNAASLIRQLEEELKEAQDTLAHTDQRIFAYFYQKAKQTGREQELIHRYEQLAALDKETAEDIESLDDIMSVVAPAYQQRLTEEQAWDINNKIKFKEKPIKDKLHRLVEAENGMIAASQRTVLDRYLVRSYEYFSYSGFNNEALELFTSSMHIYRELITEKSFQTRKQLLDWQLTI